MTPTPLDLLHNFGGLGPLIHLAHANGFPPGTYAPFAQALAAAAPPDSAHTYHVIGLPARPLWPGSQPRSAPTWHTLADDLLQGLRELSLNNIVGLGHSMGGVYTMLAALRQPDLFRALVLIDPVILPPGWLRTVRLMRWLGLGRRQPLVQGALRRRRVWPSREACFQRYRGKPLFAHWPDASLQAYVDAGTRRRPDGQVELRYPPEWEAHIFATTPTDVWRYVQRLAAPSTPPLLVLRGQHTATFQPQAQARMQRLLPRAQFHVLPDAGHLLPMERPAETAAVIRAFLAQITG